MQNLIPVAGVAPALFPRGSVAPALDATRSKAAAMLDRKPTQAAPIPPVVPATQTAQSMPVAQLAQTAKSAGVGGVGSAKAAKVLAAEAAPDPEIAAAAARLGITDYLQPDHVTTSEAYRQVVAAIKSNPQSKVAVAERAGLEQVARRASELIEEIGGSSDLSAIASEVKGSLQGSAARMASQESSLWGKLRQEIPDTLPVEAPATISEVSKMVADMGGDARARVAMPAEARKFLGPLMDGQPITHGYLDVTRKQVGRALQKASGPFADMEQGMLKRFYSALSLDQEAVAKATSDKAYYTFQAAKYATRLKKGFEDDLASLFGRELDRSFVASGGNSLPSAFTGLARGDSAPLGRLLGSIPQELRPRVVASGLTTVFRKASTRGELDFTGYAKWFERLQQNRQAYSAVMSELPLSARKQLTALYRISSGVSESLNRRTKTGALNTIKAEMMGTDSVMENLYSLAKRSGAAIAIEPVTTSIGMPGAGIAAAVGSALTKGKPKSLIAIDDLIASPEFEQMTRSINTPQQAKAAQKLAKAPEFKALQKALGNPSELNDGQRWLLQAMQQQAAQQAQPRSDTLH